MRQTDVNNALAGIKFKVSDLGPLKPIIDVGNPDYYTSRAIEAINNAKNGKTRKADLQLAARLLLLTLSYESP